MVTGLHPDVGSHHNVLNYWVMKKKHHDKPLWPGEETFLPAGHSFAKWPSSPQLRQLLSKTAKVIACCH